ncbi:MAG: hypothetical protein LBL90_07710 [Prevotellaceae bacterium]|jgi:hypothetical protein|nr:hypothetical protein [Prevotellaceae bacterium]
MIKPLDLLTPVPDRLRNLCEHKSVNLAGNCIEYITTGFNEEDLRQYNIALLGIAYQDAEQHLNTVREDFYSLYLHSDHLKIIDLGNVLMERNDQSDYDRIEQIIGELLKYNVFVIPFGKSPVYLNYCYNALKLVDNSVTITYISNSATLGNAGDNLSRQNYLAHLLNDIDDKLFSLNILSYQLYQTDPDSLVLLNKLYCQATRLGSLRLDFKLVEPLLRDSDLLGINISAIRHSDAPASLHCTPNGLYAEEVCQLARYAGISDRLTIGGIFGFKLEKDNNRTTSQLVAQVMWHLIDGYMARKNDSPLKNVNGIKKYIVDMGAPMQQLVFHYSTLSERWWMEVPGETSSNNLLIACSNDDYRSACNHEVPLRWVWFHQKLSQKKQL